MILSKVKKATNPQLPVINIFGEKVLVRPIKESDLKSWQNVRGENQNYLQPYEPLWPSDCLTAEFFHSMYVQIAKDWNADRRYCFLIFTAKEDQENNTPHRKPADQYTKLIGGVNINNVQRGVTQCASFGYWLAENAQGNGYMTDALRGLLKFSFTVLKLNRINISCMPHNTPSINIARRLGFDEEGFAKKYIKINGKWEDHVLFGLTRDDWLSSFAS